jgi:hypothetical protein
MDVSRLTQLKFEHLGEGGQLIRARSVMNRWMAKDVHCKIMHTLANVK